MNKTFLRLFSSENYNKVDFSNEYIYELYDIIHNVNSEEEDIKLGLIEDKEYIDIDKDGNRYYHYNYKDNFEAVYLGNRYDGGKLNAIFIFDSNVNITDEIKIGDEFDLEKLKDAFSEYEVSIVNDEMISIKLEEGKLNIVGFNKKINEFEFYLK